MDLAQNIPAFPLSAFIQPNVHGGEVLNQETLSLLLEADIVIGRDVMSQHEFVVFGRDTLDRISNGDDVDGRLLTIEFDQDADELEMLCALIQTQRGGMFTQPTNPR